MNGSVHQFTVGSLTCTAVGDGFFTYTPPMFPPPAQFLFVNAPQDRLTTLLTDHGLEPQRWDEWTSPYTCLLVDTGSSRVLVDTGAGRLGPGTGRLVQSLSSVGVGPQEIDVVVLTHGHPDHLGGNTRADGSLTFPKAEWLIAQAEWDFWVEGAAEKAIPEHSKEILVGTAQRNLSPIADSVTLVSGGEEIAPGVNVVPAPGHTPGHMAVTVSSAGEELLCLADLVLHPVHLEEPGWYAAVDMLPDRLVTSRRSLLDKAAQTQSLVMAFHFPFPGLGRLSPKRDGWAWTAVEQA